MQARVIALNADNLVASLRRRFGGALTPTADGSLAPKIHMWLAQQSPGMVPAYPWGDDGTAMRDEQKARFLQTALAQLPAFRENYDKALATAARAKQLKRALNGVLAAQITGLSGRPLGDLMQRVRNAFPTNMRLKDCSSSPAATASQRYFLRRASQPNSARDQDSTSEYFPAGLSIYRKLARAQTS